MRVKKRNKKSRSVRDKSRYFVLTTKRLFQGKSSPHTVAFGMAVGVFVGTFFPYGTHALVALGIAYLLRSDKLAALLGTFFNNPLTALPIYLVAWKIGSFSGNVDYNRFDPKSFLTLNIENLGEFFRNLGHDVLLPMATGLFVEAVVASFVFYLGVRFAMHWTQTVRAARPAGRGNQTQVHSL